MNDPTMLPGALPPFLHRAFMEAKGFDDGLKGRAVRQQGDDQQHRLGIGA